MELRLHPDHAKAVLRSMAPSTRKAMRSALRSLLSDPSGRSQGLDVRRLALPGDPPAYRLRMGDWRAVWLLRPSSIDVMRIFHRSEGYGWLERMYAT